MINVLHNLFVFRYRHKGQLPLTLFRQKYRLGSFHLGGYGRRAPRLARSRECFRCKVTHFSGTPCVRHGKICRKFKLIVPHAQTSGIMSYICTRFFRDLLSLQKIFTMRTDELGTNHPIFSFFDSPCLRHRVLHNGSFCQLPDGKPNARRDCEVDAGIYEVSLHDMWHFHTFAADYRRNCSGKTCKNMKMIRIWIIFSTL